MDEPSHLRVQGRTKPLMSALVKNLSTTTYEWKEKPSHSQGPGRNLKSYYLRVKGLSRTPITDSVENLSPTTDRWNDEPSNQQVPWLKFMSSYL